MNLLKSMMRHEGFLDISEAHEGIAFKLKCNGISGNLLNFLQTYLSNRYQRVLSTGKESDGRVCKLVCPQGLY